MRVVVKPKYQCGEGRIIFVLSPECPSWVRESLAGCYWASNEYLEDRRVLREFLLPQPTLKLVFENTCIEQLLTHPCEEYRLLGLRAWKEGCCGREEVCDKAEHLA
jgi:hypothetical protein